MNNNNNTNNNTVKNDDEITNFTIQVSESKALEYPVIADGVYNATVEKLVLKANLKSKDGSFFDMIVWSFVVDDDGTMKFVEGTTSGKVTTMSKAYSWISSIIQKEPQLNSGFTPALVLGKTCQVMVKNNTEKNEFNGKTTDVIRPVVKEVLRAKKSK
jgi:hypothetical protein